jgi:hypothetical protein
MKTMSSPIKFLETVNLCQPLDSGAALPWSDRCPSRLLLAVHGRTEPPRSRVPSPTTHVSEAEVMLVVLGLIDVVMIANLLVMVIVGGYETFVSRLDLEDHPDQPEWLSHVNAGVLKIKLSTAIIGISSIHLLKSFINAANLSEHTLDVAGHHPRRIPFLRPGHGTMSTRP